VNESLDSPLPCTPAGIVELLRRYEITTKGAEVAIIGRGITVGRPLGLLMTRKGIDSTVTTIHSATKDPEHIIARADIVIAAVGVAHFVQPEWIKPGAFVVPYGTMSAVELNLTDIMAKLEAELAPQKAPAAASAATGATGVSETPRATRAEPEAIDLLELAGGDQLKKYGAAAFAALAVLVLIWVLRRSR
jgi:methylenetetrahydrofolate dehydrogenase (NADP+)/methenyltetrahydrofolate cyclohydrolase